MPTQAEVMFPRVKSVDTRLADLERRLKAIEELIAPAPPPPPKKR